MTPPNASSPKQRAAEHIAGADRTGADPLRTGQKKQGELNERDADKVIDDRTRGGKGAPASVRWLTYLLLFPLIIVATTAFGIVSLITSLWDTSGRQQHRIAQTWARMVLRIALSPVRVVHPGNLRPTGAAVYAANHLSYMDTPVLFARLPFQFRILAKQSLWKIPFIGWHLRRSGQVAVDQSTARTSITSLNRGIAALKAGMPLLLFPEGGRSATGETRAFLSGAAFMAIRAQVPLVPLTLVGTYELLPIHTYHLRPRPLLLIAGAPINTTGLTTRDADRVTEQLFQIITATYLSHSEQAAGS